MNKNQAMIEIEAGALAERLIGNFADREFEVSMPDEPSYALMRSTFAKMGRESRVGGEFFVVKVFAGDHHG